MDIFIFVYKFITKPHLLRKSHLNHLVQHKGIWKATFQLLRSKFRQWTVLDQNRVPYVRNWQEDFMSYNMSLNSFFGLTFTFPLPKISVPYQINMVKDFTRTHFTYRTYNGKWSEEMFVDFSWSIIRETSIDNMRGK